ncbi:MAG TPA: lipid-A-disaccharide synthase [Oscillatoriales cyanobacterium M59_W2019_021]|nr:MAG: lipid-A-disaccharide synthase [Cyanobacteria bacterium J055]HIK29929.1 lipid-A-disaccharide synthase [Oscillatoriales cyanobacterium M4454_W2019_049]HIK50175.1 lipid-A-disaccharide synthase [Oscillatoriales cyanobacterium M59_W2019_021]
MPSVDILILTNGPGEIATWVRPVVRTLRQQLKDDRDRVRISVVLSPCPNASGKEAEIARSYPEIDRVQAAKDFWAFLFWGKTAQNWHWRKRGVVLFLGGDQLFTVILGRRLGYRTVVYAEWEARWHRWIDRFGVMKPEVMAGVSPKYARKFTVVGDLMAEIQRQESQRRDPPTPQTELIGILPGSKTLKLSQGVPLGLSIAESLHKQRPQTRFVIPVAPTLNIETLARFAHPKYNPLIRQFKWTTGELYWNEKKFRIGEISTSICLKTPSGLNVYLWTQYPAYELLSQCQLCLTTVGANTAELGSLAVPMLVLLPTHQLDAMRAWDGLPGLLANLPIFGSPFARLVNRIMWFLLTRKGKKTRFAWPNIWAGEAIVPELVGRWQADEVAELAIDYLDHPEKLQEMGDRLRKVRGKAGAAEKLVRLVREELKLGRSTELV